MVFYLWKPNPDGWIESEKMEREREKERERERERERGNRTPPKAADTVVGLVHDLDVNPPVDICAVIE